jgi:hypothetical protein
MASWTDWKLNDLIWGIIVPVIVAFLIIIFPLELGPILADVDPGGTLQAIFVDGLGEALLTIGIPLFAGLIWNQWAGGGTGFILGSIYALFVNDSYVSVGAYTDTVMAGGNAGDIGVFGYVICAMLTGYIAGALNRGSFSFRRMLIAGLVAAIIGGLFLQWTQLITPFSMITDLPHALFLTFLPRVIYGIVVPIFATVFGWFGITPKQMM